MSQFHIRPFVQGLAIIVGIRSESKKDEVDQLRPVCRGVK
jgi:hypothetical protein